MVKNREINETGPYFLCFLIPRVVAKANERTYYMRALQWRHKEHYGVPYH